MAIISPRAFENWLRLTACVSVHVYNANAHRIGLLVLFLLRILNLLQTLRNRCDTA